MTNHWMLGGGDDSVSLSEVKAPTLVMHGTADPLFPYGHAEALAREIEGARLVPLEGGGHRYRRRPPGTSWSARSWPTPAPDVRSAGLIPAREPARGISRLTHMHPSRHFTRTLAGALASSALVACGASGGSGLGPDPDTTTPASQKDTGLVVGTVLAGPTCAVETVSKPCPDAPVGGATVRLHVAGSAVATDQTDAQGRFRMSGPLGRAVVLLHSPSEMGSDTERPIRLRTDHTTLIKITVDTGIR